MSGDTPPNGKQETGTGTGSNPKHGEGVRLITIDNKGMPRTRTQDGQKDIENWKGAVMGKQASSALELLE